jgi:hypothetical protein
VIKAYSGKGRLENSEGFELERYANMVVIVGAQAPSQG